MATISSHVLDSVLGDHAKAIAVQCIRTADRSTLFSVIASSDGRISETVNMEAGEELELVFDTADYFSKRGTSPADGGQILEAAVVRLRIKDADGKYHIPMMISPHSYTIWWSGVDPQ